jgi:hypothetical protein
VKAGLILIDHAKFEALFAGLDSHRVRALEAKAPTLSKSGFAVRHDGSDSGFNGHYLRRFLKPLIFL